MTPLRKWWSCKLVFCLFLNFGGFKQNSCFSLALLVFVVEKKKQSRQAPVRMRRL
jgi:hypothetical protein